MFQCTDCEAVVTEHWQTLGARNAAEAAEARMKASGLPRVFRDGTITIPVAKVFGRCAATLQGGSGVYLHGPAGTWKTSFAGAYLAKEIRAGRSGRYVYVPDLFTELSAIYSADDDRSRGDVIDRYGATPLLVVDDIDKAKASEHSAEVLLAIFDRRYREGLRGLIVTANVAVDELAGKFAGAIGESYADPLTRRIAELTVSVRLSRSGAQR